jgi:hypothetical protein
MRTWLSEKGALALWVVMVLFLTFVGGVVVAVAEKFPAKQVRDAYRAGTALYSKLSEYSDPLRSDLWSPARSDETGVTVNVADKVGPGLTLYTSGDAPKAHLISADGSVVHEWHKPFSEVWDKSSPVRRPVQDRQVYFNKARVYPDGGLLGIYIGVGDSPYGYGMVRLDADSNLIWKNLDRFHHDVDIAPDGRIYGLTHAYRQDQPEGTSFTPPLLDDYLVVVSPSDGRTLKKISLLDAVNASEFRRLLWHVPPLSLEDPLHTNGVDVLDHESAARLQSRLPVAAEGQVLLSFRELAGGTVALLDVDREVIVWAMRGPWLGQHDPDVLPNGNLLVFDNRGRFGGDTRTRVIEVDPGTGGLVWSYGGDHRRPLDSLIRGSQQRLPNGNTLITESSGGRLLEITADGEAVWEYFNPARDERDGQALTAIFSWAQRIDPESFAPEFRNRLNEHILLATEGSAR